MDSDYSGVVDKPAKSCFDNIPLKGKDFLAPAHVAGRCVVNKIPNASNTNSPAEGQGYNRWSREACIQIRIQRGFVDYWKARRSL